MFGVNCQHLESRWAQGVGSIYELKLVIILIGKSSPIRLVVDWRSHPLIHTFLKSNLTQDIVYFQLIVIQKLMALFLGLDRFWLWWLHYHHNNQQGGDRVKAWTIRMPTELMDWLREKAARETIKRKKSFSMNALAVEILTKAMEADKKKGGDYSGSHSQRKEKRIR